MLMKRFIVKLITVGIIMQLRGRLASGNIIKYRKILNIIPGS